MPGFDGTGPMGAGALTGGGFGRCGGGAALGRPGRGRGYRCAGGRGGGGGRGFYTTPTAQDEARALRARADFLRGDLEAIQRRLSELEPAE